MENLIILFKVSVLINIGHSGSFIPGISIMKYIKYEFEEQWQRKFSISVCP